MNTPICDFVNSYIDKKAIRLHMPGHKGKNTLGFEGYDITEINGADVLYHADGIIKESEKNAASLFGTYKTCYSTEGSSLCIRAMLYLVKLFASDKGEKPHILAMRNVHKVFVSSAAILDIDVSWVYSKSLISCDIDLRSIEDELKEKHPTAFFITSPDYLGEILDIQSISKLCKRYNTLLIVDNAHGAYLKFLDKSLHPIDLGADMCCDSAHKTLNVLTGGAYLHISNAAPDILKENAEKALSIFASTSPSYLILQSLDMANKLLSDSFKDALNRTINRVNKLKEALRDYGYVLVGEEPLKLTIAPKNLGYTGDALSKFLEKNNIYCEFSDLDFLVMMFTPQISENDFEYILGMLTSVKRLEEILEKPPVLNRLVQAVHPHNAINSASERIPAKDAEGKILALLSVTCPPAIPIAVCGEVIDKSAIECLKYYEIECIDIIKENA